LPRDVVVKKQIMSNFKNLLSDLRQDRQTGTLRTVVQAGFFFFCLWAGYRFYLFFLWGSGRSDLFVARPPSVEGFLPISALVGLKRLLLTGQWDMVHPAGLTILLAALAIGLFFRKGFCGWICPVGFASNLAEKTGKKLKCLFRLPAWIDLPLLSLKYLLLSFFVYMLVINMPLPQVEMFHRAPFNKGADAKMLMFFLSPSGLTGGITLFLVLISFFIRNFWCRYLCPYGGLLGILALASPMQVKRDAETCIDCKKCEKSCPASIMITRRETVRTAECIGCTECISVCPVTECLTLGVPFKKKIPALTLPLLVLGLFFLCWLVALTTGHWQTEVPPETMRLIYSKMFQL